MKQLFTLLIALACNLILFGQVSEDFEPQNGASPLSALSASCWQFTNINWSNASILSNTGSIFIGPITNGRETGNFSTPFLNCNGPVTLSFMYCVRNKLNNPATRTVEVGYTNQQGIFTRLDIIVITSSSPAAPQTYTNTFINIPTGIHRFTFMLSGNADGNTNLYFDKLNINQPQYYTSGCNTAPIARDDNFTSTTLSVLTGNILNNDSDVDGENITATIIQQPTTGLLSLNADGSFKFLPALDFTGGPVSFTYLVTDKGCSPLNSNVATVTMNYIPDVTLPIRLLNFQVSLSNHKAVVEWQVEENESGYSFEVQKSNDGKDYKTIGLIFTSEKNSKALYLFREQEVLRQPSFYRLKITDRESKVIYSKTISINKVQLQNRQTFAYQCPTLSQNILQYHSLSNELLTIKLYNTQGTLYKTLKQKVSVGINTIPLQLEKTNSVVVVEILAGKQRSVIKLSN